MKKTLGALGCVRLRRWKECKENEEFSRGILLAPSSKHHWYLRSGRRENPGERGGLGRGNGAEEKQATEISRDVILLHPAA